MAIGLKPLSSTRKSAQIDVISSGTISPLSCGLTSQEEADCNPELGFCGRGNATVDRTLWHKIDKLFENLGPTARIERRALLHLLLFEFNLKSGTMGRFRAVIYGNSTKEDRYAQRWHSG
jgi:hypothetical protein